MIRGTKEKLENDLKLYKKDIDVYEAEIDEYEANIEMLKYEIKRCEDEIEKIESKLDDIYDIKDGIQWIDVKYDEKLHTTYLFFYAEDCEKPYKIVDFPNTPKEFAEKTYQKLYSYQYGGVCGIEAKFSLGDLEYI